MKSKPNPSKKPSRFKAFKQLESPDRILQGLYLGPVTAAQNQEVLCELKVTHILTVGYCMRPLFTSEFKYKVIPVSDSAQSKLCKYFDECTEFINEALQTGTVLVHCFGGVSRSPSVVIAYLMRYCNLNFSNALAYVKDKRSVVNPNSGFLNQLKNYQRILRNRNIKLN